MVAQTHSIAMRLTLFNLLGLVVSVRTLATCFYPDGITTAPGHVPCNQTGTAASACCDPLDACSQSGFCLGRSGWNYRGSCTDKTWGSNNCARQYASCLTDPFLNTPYRGFTPVWSCALRGTGGNSWCCTTGDGSKSCCNASFNTFLTGGAFMPGLDQFVINITRAAQENSNVTSTSPNNTYNNNNDNNSADGNLGTKVGLGVGIPLGVLVLGLLVWLFFREIRRRKFDAAGARTGATYSTVGTSSPRAYHSTVTSPVSEHTNRASSYATYDTGITQMQQHADELTLPKTNPYGGARAPVYEAPNGSGIHEMRA